MSLIAALALLLLAVGAVGAAYAEPRTDDVIDGGAAR